MKQHLSILQETILLNEEDIQSLKRYIQGKFPHASSRERALVLSDAVHRALDGKIPLFPQATRMQIRRKLMEDAVTRTSFVIDAGDVFWVCLNEALPFEQTIDALWLWFNRELAIDLSRRELWSLACSIREKISRENLSNFEGLLHSLTGTDGSADSSGNRTASNRNAPVSAAAVTTTATSSGLSTPVVASSWAVTPASVSVQVPTVTVAAAKAPNSATGSPPLAAPPSAVLSPLKIASSGDRTSLQKARRLSQPVQEKWKWTPYVAACLVMIVLSLSIHFRSIPSGVDTALPGVASAGEKAEAVTPTIQMAPELTPEQERGGNELPPSLRYCAVREDELRQWLDQRDSLLAEEPYFSVILQTAKEYDIHPLFLFAITGQEQGFVPRTEKEARRIANNPFNVYRSWRKYNTHIRDAAEIAAVTIVSLSKDRPEGVDPVAWLNKQYSEDKQWHKGVKSLFSALMREVGEK
ncbi:hypothetical protein GTO89_16815 [Heliobacterium gestii]|uniref:Uncharacterized protein n=1 Tax=Heliomicrobium gestii TaxID=2699 RepID=A0A845LET1_HELGE|nr:hypothetical protein [Heliomicrobium gestii]MBM7868520.1 hypothetical protein [Heliomicrobium gestii]MZP44678.1 hypothetical protein [Heliomicrobium gestii]